MEQKICRNGYCFDFLRKYFFIANRWGEFKYFMYLYIKFFWEDSGKCSFQWRGWYWSSDSLQFIRITNPKGGMGCSHLQTNIDLPYKLTPLNLFSNRNSVFTREHFFNFKRFVVFFHPFFSGGRSSYSFCVL
jgi:hypothetical protein